MKRLLASAVMAGLVTACGGTVEEPTAKLASVDLGMAVASFGDFSGNSVEICGWRGSPSAPVVADGKYACSNTAPCQCFQFNADGTLASANGGPARFDDLCPSADVPSADWQFDYHIFSDLGCLGEELTADGANFVCYDLNDLAKREHPNQSVEALLPGSNSNVMVCYTKNASKFFNFDSCMDESSDTEIQAGVLRLNCGCTPTGQGVSCRCPDGVGIKAGLLPYGCMMAPPSCQVVCASPEQ